jgi:hypothetical protein
MANRAGRRTAMQHPGRKVLCLSNCAQNPLPLNAIIEEILGLREDDAPLTSVTHHK